MDFGSDASLKLTGKLTVELWVNRADSTTFERFLSHSTDANTFAYEVGVITSTLTTGACSSTAVQQS